VVSPEMRTLYTLTISIYGCISMQRYWSSLRYSFFSTLFLLAADLRRHPTALYCLICVKFMNICFFKAHRIRVEARGGLPRDAHVGLDVREEGVPLEHAGRAAVAERTPRRRVVHGVVFDQWARAFARDCYLRLGTKRGEGELRTSLFGQGCHPRLDMRWGDGWWLRILQRAGYCLQPLDTCPR